MISAAQTMPKPSSMSKVDVVKTHIEVENQHDMEAMLATLVDEDPVREEVAGKTYRGRDAVAGRYRALWDAFPDFTVTPQLFVEDENGVAMEAIYTGTHRGIFNGHPPSGKSFRTQDCGDVQIRRRPHRQRIDLSRLRQPVAPVGNCRSCLAHLAP